MIYDKGVYRLELNSKRLFREQIFSPIVEALQPQSERAVISAESYFVGN
ncbi:MAG: hypothetical protein HQ580_13985 [Planctomycetes bacterium]|nr:hypothetical protein [Planctomycetota bacterium]